MLKIEEKRNGTSIIYRPENAVFSGHYLKLIPVNPDFSPKADLQKDLVDLLSKTFTVNEIESYLSSRVEFIDPGAHFEKVTCNICSENIDMNVWSDLVSEWYKKENNSLAFLTPCCNSKSNLNDLIYDSPSGFSKYLLQVNNAEYKLEIVDGVKEAIELKSGEEFRVIWAHY